ncbi:hypothetical protein M569_07521 [Genlisea aurea]|uniref:Glycosyltransferase 61 catalytic domain-containing protein n=1 Tax=Genlisea aurea TaxID=192259 RepID=S8CKL8_9LAMI|nr:hypothetical protein M569_07521 [Genlisea aurea]
MKIVYGSSVIVYLLIFFSVLCVGVDFIWSQSIISFDPWVEYFSGESGGRFDENFFKYHLGRLVRGEDKKRFEEVGFACHRDYFSILCVTDRPVMIDTRKKNMTVYVSSDEFSDGEIVFRPYARRYDEPTSVTPVRIVRRGRDGNPPECQFNHSVPAVVFSAGGMGNIFHEVNEMVIPLFITAKQFQSQVQFVVGDQNRKFMFKFGKVLGGLSDYEAIDPSEKQGILCFPSAVVGLKYHGNLALNSSDIPGGYSMTDFRRFLRRAYDLKFDHVSQIRKPRLALLSRTTTRRILNEEEVISEIRQVGFEPVVIRRSKNVSDVNDFSKLINSCKVLVGVHGAGLTNEIFLPDGAAMIQLELLGMEWGSNAYYGDTARAMHVIYLKYKIQREESSLLKLYGRDHPAMVHPDSVYELGGYPAARAIFLDQQNVRVNLTRFRATLVEALSIVSN